MGDISIWHGQSGMKPEGYLGKPEKFLSPLSAVEKHFDSLMVLLCCSEGLELGI